MRRLKTYLRRTLLGLTLAFIPAVHFLSGWVESERHFWMGAAAILAAPMLLARNWNRMLYLVCCILIAIPLVAFWWLRYFSEPTALMFAAGLLLSNCTSPDDS